MDLLHRIFARKPNSGRDPEPRRAPAPQESDFNAAEILLMLNQSRDLDQVLRGLDAHLERIQEQGRESEAALLLCWAEEQLERTQRPQPAHCALWGNICQRIGADQIADPFLRALAFYEKALDGYRSAQEMEGLAIVHNNMGLAYMGLAQNDADNYRSAIPLLEKALHFYEVGDDWSRRADICLSLGEAYTGLEESGLDRFELAREYLERSRALYERSGDSIGQAQAQGQLGDVQMQLVVEDREAALERAIRHYRNALVLFAEQDEGLASAHYQERLARAYLGFGKEEHLRKSLRSAQRASQLYEKHDQIPALAGICLIQGQTHLDLAQLGAEEELLTAFKEFHRALGLYRKIGDRSGRADCLAGLAQIYLSSEDATQAVDLRQALDCLEEALAIYELEDRHAAVAEIKERLDQARRFADSFG